MSPAADPTLSSATLGGAWKVARGATAGVNPAYGSTRLQLATRRFVGDGSLLREMRLPTRDKALRRARARGLSSRRLRALARPQSGVGPRRRDRSRRAARPPRD